MTLNVTFPCFAVSIVSNEHMAVRIWSPLNQNIPWRSTYVALKTASGCYHSLYTSYMRETGTLCSLSEQIHQHQWQNTEVQCLWYQYQSLDTIWANSMHIPFQHTISLNIVINFTPSSCSKRLSLQKPAWKQLLDLGHLIQALSDVLPYTISVSGLKHTGFFGITY